MVGGTAELRQWMAEVNDNQRYVVLCDHGIILLLLSVMGANHKPTKRPKSTDKHKMISG